MRLTPAGQYCQLVMHVQETRAFVDILKCFKDADVVLADTMLAEVQALVLRLHEKLPEFEKRYVGCNLQVCKMYAKHI